MSSAATARRVILIISAVMALGAVAYAWAVHQARGPRIALEGDSLRVQGPLVDASVAAALQLLQSSPVPITRIVLRSQGGDMRAAMRLGHQVHARGLDVEVDAYCLAACANYVFTAGSRKRILASSLVAWFGSASAPDFLNGSWEANWRAAQGCETSTPDCEVRLGTLRDYLQAARTEQAAFFRQIGVDERITLYGQVERGCQCSWTLSAADMAAFGIDQVEIIGPYLSDLSYWARQAASESQVRLLRLDEQS